MGKFTVNYLPTKARFIKKKKKMANSKTRHLFIVKDSLTFFVPFFALGAIGIAIGFLLDDA